jgi:glutathione S-transferase
MKFSRIPAIHVGRDGAPVPWLAGYPWVPSASPTDATMLTIYGPGRSRASRALWMLAECGVPYTHEDLTRYPTMAEKAAAVKQVYPLGKIPVLTDGDLVLAESMAINLYLAQHYGTHLWPDTKAEQASALQWSFFAVTEIDPPLVQLMIERTFRKEPDRDAANEQRNAEQIRRPLGYLNDHLASHAWLVGQAFTVADLNVASVLTMRQGAKLEVTDYPQVEAWLARCYDRPAYLMATAPK